MVVSLNWAAIWLLSNQFNQKDVWTALIKLWDIKNEKSNVKQLDGSVRFDFLIPYNIASAN